MSSQSDKKIVISIEGNIGVGKSSFLGLLKEYFGDKADFIYEPVNEWLAIKDENGKDLLQTFYDDKKRWSYTFQNVAYITRMTKLVDAINTSSKKYIIIDRSLNADLNTFTKMLRESGDINQLEYSSYMIWNDFFNKNYGDKIEQYIIYLRCDPLVAYNRTKIRHRSQEETIPLGYLTDLHNAHEAWLADPESAKKDIKLSSRVLTLDANSDFVYNKDKFAKFYSQFMIKIITDWH
jgi:deoxyadenosine/deoxycytidine kinase